MDYKVDFESLMDSRNRFRTRSLFIETRAYRPEEATGEIFEPIFTFRNYPYQDKIPMGRVFVEERDPTGYKTAMRLLGSWQHWQ